MNFGKYDKYEHIPYFQYANSTLIQPILNNIPIISPISSHTFVIPKSVGLFSSINTVNRLE